MRLTVTGAAWMALAMATGNISFAQMQDNTEKLMSCQNSGSDGDRARHCEVRETSVASIGRLSVDGGTNGGATVKGWLRSDVLVRARIEASAETQSAASSLASQVSIDASGGQVKANGPAGAGESWWSVSYEIFVPQNTDVTMKAHNGGVTISDVRGQIQFDVNNGGVKLKRVAGEIKGSTNNGGIDVELAGNMFDGRQMDLSTHNGGVTLSVPSTYSAHVVAETGQGHIQSDFPTPPAVATANGSQPRQLDFNVGAGGPLIHIKTGNGGVRLKRAESK